MILTCPQCATRYQTDAARFPPGGRKVKCAKCGHLWHQAGPEPEVESAPESAPPQSAPAQPGSGNFAPSPPLAVHQPKARVSAQKWAERFGLIAGWAGLAAMIVLIGWTALRFRQEIATLWPQSSSLFGALGVPVNSRGIEFADVAYRREVQDGQSVLAVTGRLVNVSARELTVPPVRVTLTDDDRRELYHWNFTPAQATLKPGQTENFVTRLTSPPPAARHLQVRFANPD